MGLAEGLSMLAKGTVSLEGALFPRTLLGARSHTATQ
jgi:hypothetical protein